MAAFSSYLNASLARRCLRQCKKLKQKCRNMLLLLHSRVSKCLSLYSLACSAGQWTWQTCMSWWISDGLGTTGRRMILTLCGWKQACSFTLTNCFIVSMSRPTCVLVPHWLLTVKSHLFTQEERTHLSKWSSAMASRIRTNTPMMEKTVVHTGFRTSTGRVVSGCHRERREEALHFFIRLGQGVEL